MLMKTLTITKAYRQFTIRHLVLFELTSSGNSPYINSQCTRYRNHSLVAPWIFCQIKRTHNELICVVLFHLIHHRWMTDSDDIQNAMDSMLGNAYVYGREWIGNKVRHSPGRWGFDEVQCTGGGSHELTWGIGDVRMQWILCSVTPTCMVENG